MITPQGGSADSISLPSSAARRVDVHPARGDLKIMADSTKLSLTARAPEGSRTARRLRRSGEVPGVIYGGDGEPSHFSVDARILRNTLAHSGAILDISIDGGDRLAGARQGPPAPPGARRDRARGPAPREHERDDPHDGRARADRRRRRARRHRGRRALPGDARGQHRGAAGRHPGLDRPRRLRACRSTTRSRCRRSRCRTAITLLDDLEETVIATITPPTLEPVEEEIETETELVGEEGAEAGRGRGRRGGRRVRPSPRTKRPEVLLLHTGRLADRRARQPRARLRARRRTTSASRSRRSWRGAGTCRRPRRSSPVS